MILSGATLKTVLKRDISLVGNIETNTQCVTVVGHSVEKCTKPGLYRLEPAVALTANSYGMLVSVNPKLMENCEVSYAHFIPAHQESLPVLYVRPAEKDFSFETLDYIYKLYVVDGRIRK